jgi:Reverse transcriptase (RNA-dependent DNA polymerase)
MIKQQDTSPVEVNLDRFTSFNKRIFNDDDIIPDTYTPLTSPSDHHISTDELTNILRYKYKADKSRGLSKLPP